MKKRLLSALLALALVFVLLPTTALASSIDPDITIAGTEYDFELENYKENTYKTVYYQHDKFLTKFEYTSDGVWATDPYLELTKTGAGNATTITITVHKGSNTTKAFEIKSAETCIATSSSYWNLVITGSGALSLTHTGTSAAIWSNHSNITITGGVTVNVKGTKSGSNINSYSNAIQCGETFTVSNGATVVAENNSTYSNGPAVKTEKFIISGDAKFEAQSAYGGKAISFDSITADGYDFMGRSGNSGSYTTLTGDDKATKLQEYSSVKITPTPTPALEKSDVSVAGTKLYKNTAYTIQEGKPVMGGTYPDNYNIYLDATNYVLHVKNATIEATYTGIYGVSNIVFEGTNSITAGQYGIISYSKQFDLNISGSGSLTVTTYAGNSAIATDYYTSKSIIISGKDFTVTADTSRTNVSAIYSDKGGLTIKDGAIVKAISANNSKAIRIGGSLTVTDATLTATSTSDKKPTIEVDGSATLAGSKVEITNNSTRQGKSGKNSYEVSTGLYVGGTLDIKNAAKVTSTVIGGNAIYAKGDITISGDNTEVKATNDAYKFSAISTNGTVNISDNSTVKAENLKKHQGDPTGETDPSTGKTYNACPAITGKIANKNTQNKLHIAGFTTSSAGSQNPTEGTPLYLDIAPGSVEPYIHHYKVTITRGDAYVAPTKTITKIIVTGLTPPVKGATPVDKSKVTLTDGLTVESITWGPALTSDGKFAANTAYTAHINYSVKAGYELAANANCPQVAGANVTRWHQEGMPQDEIEVTFPKTAADTPTEKPTITLDLPAPVAGVAPVTTGVTATSSDNTPLTIDKVEWYAYTVEYNNGKFERIVEGDKVSGNFEANTYYFAEITFDKSISFANGGLNITAPTWPLEGSWPESCIYRVIENIYTAKILFPATDAACNHQPGDWQDGTDGEHHVKVCAICHNVVATESHAFGGYQINTNNSHTRVCSVCNAAYTNAHEFNSYAHNENSHWKVCVCGATTSYANHEFDPATGACACGATQSGGNPTPDVPAAPTGLAGVAPTSANSKDGKITGTTAAMEYATEPNGSNWIECGGDEVTGLSAGTYYVRYKRTTDKPASAVATVVVPAYSGGGEIVPPTPDNPGTIVIIRPAEEEKPAQQPNPSTGANDLVGLAVAAAVAAALGSAALLRKHD